MSFVPLIFIDILTNKPVISADRLDTLDAIGRVYVILTQAISCIYFERSPRVTEVTQERRDVATLAYFAILFILQSITRFIQPPGVAYEDDNHANKMFQDMVISVFLNLLDMVVFRAMLFECQHNVSLSNEAVQPISAALNV